jgi:hypothetical protein
MIKIDEIYNHTFWPFIKQNIPLTRMFYCDPPGRSDPESLINYGNQPEQLHYIMFHDQEPIHLDIHNTLFFLAQKRNVDLNFNKGPVRSALITSEHNSEFVEHVCSQFGWRPYYYFFHGWAALDWYRGYDKTFLMPAPKKRSIKKSFISPNRIIGGRRQHRVDLMHQLLQQGVNNAWISFPKVCPVENTHIKELAGPDRALLFKKANLPWNFPGEDNHPMHSFCLSLFDESAESLAYVATETVFDGNRHHLTEKSFKPICLRMPFVMVSTAGSLEYLRSYGFQTFNDIWDESYDLEKNDQTRLSMIADLLIYLDRCSEQKLQSMFDKAMPIIEFNYNHFYNGGFEKILWNELTNMLEQIKQDFND